MPPESGTSRLQQTTISDKEKGKKENACSAAAQLSSRFADLVAGQPAASL